MSAVQQRVIRRRIPTPSCATQRKPQTFAFVRPMRIELSLTAAEIQVVITGELDFGTAPRLDRLFRLLEGFPHPVSVDLSGVGFTDSTGMSPLFASAARRAAAGAPEIRLTALSDCSRRVLDVLSDLDEVRLLARTGLAR